MALKGSVIDLKFGFCDETHRDQVASLLHTFAAMIYIYYIYIWIIALFHEGLERFDPDVPAGIFSARC